MQYIRYYIEDDATLKWIQYLNDVKNQNRMEKQKI